jgi:hypothetical protein
MPLPIARVIIALALAIAIVLVVGMVGKQEGGLGRDDIRRHCLRGVVLNYIQSRSTNRYLYKQMFIQTDVYINRYIYRQI